MWRVTGLGVLVVAVLVCGSCFGGGMSVDNGDGGDNTLSLVKTTWDIGGSDIELDLKGPDAPVILTVTYFIFGSDVNLGVTGIVPLLHERLDEQQVAELGFGDQLTNVDLIPWEQYPYIYLRAVGTVPNLSFLLEPGKRYEFSAR